MQGLNGCSEWDLSHRVLCFPGSIFGNSEVAVLERAVTRERFKEMNQRLPDWTSCNTDQHEQLRPVPTRKLLPAAPSSLYKPSSSKTQPAH